EPRRGPPVPEQPGLHVLLGQGLLEQRIVVEIDLADRQVVGCSPIGVDEIEFLVRQCLGHSHVPSPGPSSHLAAHRACCSHPRGAPPPAPTLAYTRWSVYVPRQAVTVRPRASERGAMRNVEPAVGFPRRPTWCRASRWWLDSFS